MEEVYDIPYDESLLMNFFGGSIYFIFNTEEEKKIFFEYVNFYDNRWDKIPSCTMTMNSAAWLESRLLHKKQVEWANDINYFKKYDMRPVNFSLVFPYCKKISKLSKAAKTFWASIEETFATNNGE